MYKYSSNTTQAVQGLDAWAGVGRAAASISNGSLFSRPPVAQDAAVSSRN